jgi:hypothetical protein
MLDRRHARLAVLALVALGLLLADAQLALIVLPTVLVVAIPLSGAFLGEALIVARRALRTPRLRPVRARWASTDRVAPVSLLERSPRTLRGPPVVA